MNRSLAVVASIAACVNAAAALAGGTHEECEPLGSAPRQERLSEFLHELAKVRKLNLENWSRDDPLVRHWGGGDMELMAALSGQANLLVRYGSTTQCPGKWQIKAIWVLPGESSADRSKTPPLASPPSASERAAMDLFTKAHGGPK